jgi:glycosyltransferase involved in cell wall biosynthesis
VSPPSTLSFDLVVATVGRTVELGELFASLEAQAHPALRVLVADQNDDDRVIPVVAAHPALDVLRLRSPRGLSRARNVALEHLRADVVGFPDDDCRYPADLLACVVRRFADEPGLGGITGRTTEEDGTASERWSAEPGRVTQANLWHRCNSASTFLRRSVVAEVGAFDERLGLGSGTPWSSGEEIDYVARALATGAQVEYDPTLVVNHALRRPAAHERRAVGRRDGGSVGHVLARQRFPARIVARMFVRPVGGVAVSLVRLDLDEARFNAAALRGRLAGYRAGRATSSSAKSSA